MKHLLESVLYSQSNIEAINDLKMYFKTGGRSTTPAVKAIKELPYLNHNGMIYAHNGKLSYNFGSRSSNTAFVRDLLADCLPPLSAIRKMLNNPVTYVYGKHHRPDKYREFTVADIHKFIDWCDLRELWQNETNAKFANLVHQLNAGVTLGPPVCVEIDGRYKMVDGRHRTVISLMSGAKTVRMLVLQQDEI